MAVNYVGPVRAQVPCQVKDVFSVVERMPMFAEVEAEVGIDSALPCRIGNLVGVVSFSVLCARQGNVGTMFLLCLDKVDDRLGRPGKLEVAEEMENFHKSQMSLLSKNGKID